MASRPYLRRAVALARVEVPAMERVTVNPDCSMEGLEELAADATDGGVETRPTSITAHLLALLVTFIGEPLTVPLVRRRLARRFVGLIGLETRGCMSKRPEKDQQHAGENLANLHRRAGPR